MWCGIVAGIESCRQAVRYLTISRLLCAGNLLGEVILRHQQFCRIYGVPETYTASICMHRGTYGYETRLTYRFWCVIKVSTSLAVIQVRKHGYDIEPELTFKGHFKSEKLGISMRFRGGKRKTYRRKV